MGTSGDVAQNISFFDAFIEIRSALRYIEIHPADATQCMITPKKSLGQNFLRDTNIARKIVRTIHVQPTDILLEIGPGQGALTKYLVGSCKKTIGVEIDDRAAQLLREMFGDQLELLQTDILEVDLGRLAAKEQGKIRIVGNIPYYITSEILFWIFEQWASVSDATLMMQLEVAQRLCSKPKTKEYGILSVATQFYSEPEILFKVSRNAFFPRPDVDSALVRLVLKQTVPECNRELFHNLVRSTFGKRRKTLRNGLRSMGFDDQVLMKLPADLGRRAEELSVNEFVELSNMLEPFSNSL